MRASARAVAVTALEAPTVLAVDVFDNVELEGTVDPNADAAKANAHMRGFGQIA